MRMLFPAGELDDSRLFRVQPPNLRFHKAGEMIAAEVHVNKDGHVVVECQCPRCKEERAEAEQRSPLVLREPESGYVHSGYLRSSLASRKG